MPTDEIGIAGDTTQHSFPVFEDLTEKRLPNRMDVYQVHWAARLLRQPGNEHEFLNRCERTPGVDGKIEIAVHASFTSRQRTEHNGEPHVRLRTEDSQDRLRESWVYHQRTLEDSGPFMMAF